MHPIGMNEAMRDEAVVLLETSDRNGVKNQPSHDVSVLPCQKADDDGNDDDNGGVIDGHCAVIFLDKWAKMVKKMNKYSRLNQFGKS